MTKDRRQLEAEGAGEVPGGERGAVAQVDDPLPGVDAAAQLVGVDRLRAATGRRARAPALLMTPMWA